MPEIDRLLRRAALRLLLVRFARAVVVSVGVGVGILLLLRVAERLFAVPMDWGLAWAGVMGIAVLGAAAWVVALRADRLAVAREVDERADLRESIGTALCVRERGDGWSRATVEHARGVSRRVVVRQLFPLTLHRSWPVPVVGAVLFLVLGLLPQADLLSLLETAQAEQRDQEEIATAQQQVESAEKEVRDALKDVPGLEDALSKADDPEAGKTPEEIRRESIKELTTLADKLNELQDSEKAKTLNELSDRMRQLTQPNAGPSELDEMVKAMQKGDFEGASKAMEKLAAKMQSGDLTDAQTRELAAQMQKLADQMKAVAAQQSALENQLAKMGLDKALASNPQALQKALQNAQNLTAQQREQLMKAAQACQNASKSCQGMAGACQNAADSLAKGGSGMQGMNELAGQLSAAEMLQQEMAGLKAAQGVLTAQLTTLGQCQGGSSDMMDIYKRLTASAGMGAGAGKGVGPGAGRSGTGGGPAPDPLTTPYSLNTDRAKTNFDPETPIIGETLVRGTQVRGEASQELREAVHASSEAAAEAIETKAIPREYHDAIKHYFGNLEKESEGTSESSAGDDKPEPASDPSPESNTK